MLHRTLFALAAAALFVAGAARADLTESLKKGTPDLKSISALSFAGDGVLLVGDPAGAAIFAIDTGDTKAAGTDAVKVEGLDGKLAQTLQTDAKQILIKDLAVNPDSGNVYIGVHRGTGADAMPVLIKLDRKGNLSDVPLKDVKFAKVTLPNAGKSQDAITSLGYAKGKVFVAGLSSEKFASTLRVIPFPFKEADPGTGVEIFHGAHGKFETASPVRTFVPFDIKGETHLLAAYTCTPLVKFPVKDLEPGKQLRGTTIAELGSGNRPLDMITYTKDGKDFVLLCNSKRGVMKITTENIDKIDGITTPVGGGKTAGLTYDTIKELQGVEHLAKLDKERALILVNKGGSYNLETIALP
jgi:hypothetical protein